MLSKAGLVPGAAYGGIANPGGGAIFGIGTPNGGGPIPGVGGINPGGGIIPNGGITPGANEPALFGTWPDEGKLLGAELPDCWNINSKLSDLT